MNIPSASAGPLSVADPWFRRFSAPIVFLIFTLSSAGAYLAFRIPVSVFPTTDFPRVVIGVDNGVTPIDQMHVAMRATRELRVVRHEDDRRAHLIDLFEEFHHLARHQGVEIAGRFIGQ